MDADRLTVQDQPDAMTPAEVSEGLGLDTLKNRQWSIHKSCAIKGEGLEEGLDWCVSFFLSFPLAADPPSSSQAGHRPSEQVVETPRLPPNPRTLFASLLLSSHLMQLSPPNRSYSHVFRLLYPSRSSFAIPSD